MARAVAERIHVSITATERSRIASSRRQVSPGAYEAYVRGLYFPRPGNRGERRGRPSTLPEGDRRRPVICSGLCRNGGIAIRLWAISERWRRSRHFNKARVAAVKALELDSMLPRRPTRALAYQLFFGEWDFARADRAFARAVELEYTNANWRWLMGSI